MQYAVLIQRGQSKAADLADALSTGQMKPASVYVIGITDTDAFASILLGEVMEIDTEFDSSQALKVKFSEAVGTEADGTPLKVLVSAAKKRADELNAMARATR